MMIYDNTRLQELREKVARKRHLDHILNSLCIQRSELSLRTQELEAVVLKEQKDVDRLERRSLASFYFNVIGRLDEKLDRERTEAYAARVKYDTAAQCLASVERDIAAAADERERLAGCEADYERELRKKQDIVKNSGTREAQEILRMEAALTELQSRLRELEEALAAGEQARSTAQQVIAELESADGLATWDLVGGGLLADMAKHDRLNRAQSLVDLLQSQLHRFHSELTDVSIQANIQASVDGFLSVADFFFDGLFADWAVKDRISRALERSWDTRERIETVINRLHCLHDTASAEHARMKEALENAVVRAGE